MATPIKQIPVQIQTLDGEKTYYISRFPAIAGRRIIANYSLSAIPKLGSYDINEATMFQLMSYVAVQPETGPMIYLTTPALIDNHVDSWETSARIEKEVITYNCSFFQNGSLSTFFENFVENLPVLISKISTLISVPSSTKEKPVSTN